MGLLDKLHKKVNGGSVETTGSIQSIQQANTEPEEKIIEAIASVTITADQCEVGENVVLQGVRAVCEGMHTDGRVKFRKEGNVRSTFVQPNTEVEVLAEPQQTPTQNTSTEPTPEPQATVNVPATTPTNTGALIEASAMRALLAKINPDIASMLDEEDVLPEVPNSFPMLKMKKITNSVGRELGMFVVKSGELEEAVSTKMVGIIAFQRPHKQCYMKKYSKDDKSSPDCFSKDGNFCYGGKGFGVVTDPHAESTKISCKNCPYNEFGTSDMGKGKKCSDRIHLYMYVPELEGKFDSDGLFLFDVSATSIKKVSTYLNSLKHNTPEIDYRTIKTVIEVQAVEGATYCEITNMDIEPVTDMNHIVKALELRKKHWETISAGPIPTFPTKTANTTTSL